MTRGITPKTNRLTLVTAAAAKSGLPLSVCNRALQEMLREITRSVARGHEVHLRGLGVFYPKQRNQRPANNIISGERITVPAHKTMLARVTCPLA